MFTYSCTTKELLVINIPAIFSICDLVHQVCCCSMPCWLSERIRPTRTKTKAGRRSLTLWSSGSATTRRASSSCCGGPMHRRKEQLLTGWVCTFTLYRGFHVVFTYLSFSLSLFIETPPCAAGCAPLSLVCSPWILWVQTFLQGQRPAKEIWEVSHWLDGTLSCYTCQII